MEETVNLIPPLCGELVDLLVKEPERSALIQQANHLPSLKISTRSLCDLELLATGGFSPLDRFMGRADYESVLANMRLANGMVFPIPITLPLNEEDRSLAVPGQKIALRDARHNLLAVMEIEEAYEV